MAKNGAGVDPDIEDVPNDFGYDDENIPPVGVNMLDEFEPEVEDEEGGFVPEEDLL